MTAHDPAHRSVRERVTDRLVEVLTAHAPDQPSVLDHEDTALSVALAERHRLANARVRPERPCRRRHDVAREADAGARVRDGGKGALASRVEIESGDRRGRTARGRRRRTRPRRSRVDRFGAAADDDEDPLVHLHEEHERTRVGEIDDLVREVRDAVDVLGPADGCDEDVDPAATGSSRSMRCVEELALACGERRMEVLARRGPGALRGAGTRRARRRRAGSSSRTSASRCPRGCRARRRSPRAASAAARARRGCRRASWSTHRRSRSPPTSGDTQSGGPCSPWWSKSTVSTMGSSATLSSSPRREAVVTSTTISRWIASSSRRLVSDTAPSSSACRR